MFSNRPKAHSNKEAELGFDPTQNRRPAFCTGYWDGSMLGNDKSLDTGVGELWVHVPSLFLLSDR